MGADPTTGGAGSDALEQYLVVGGELLRQQRVAEARDRFRAARDLAPDSTRVLGLLGLACFRLSAFDEALPVYQRLVELTPEDAGHRLNLGLVHLKLGHTREAISELLSCRALDPGQTRAIGYLGLAYAQGGQYAAAYEAFLQAGQADLGREMAQYLSEEERRAIDARLMDGAAPPRDRAGRGELPDRPAVAAQGSNQEVGVISRAVQTALPSAAAAAGSHRLAPGHRGPCSVPELVTASLLRVEDGAPTMELGAGGILILRVREPLLVRAGHTLVAGGRLQVRRAARRMRGMNTPDTLGGEARPIQFVSGDGYLVAAPRGGQFAAVRIDEEALYLREDCVYAFEDALHWESGHIPGSEQRIGMMQFRGEGCVALHWRKALTSVKVVPDDVLYVQEDALAGWIGRVIPRVSVAVSGWQSAAPVVECTGEGIVLVDEPASGSVTDRP